MGDRHICFNELLRVKQVGQHNLGFQVRRLAAYFYAGNTRTPGSSGFRLRDERGSGDVIRKYRKEGVTLTLPEGKSLNNIKIFYVWCEEFAVNFGDVKIPRNLDYPRPLKIDPLQGVHGISSDNIVIVDAQTLLIPNLSYDGEAPDAKFWVGQGSKPSPQGIRVPDENGKEIPLRRYDKKTVVLTLPGQLTVFEIGHFGIWCEAFTVDFGHVLIPQNLNVPPSLKMLGVSPQKRPQQQDNSRTGVSRPRGPSSIGGNIEATTYRPRGLHFLTNRRSDNIDTHQHELFNRDISQSTNQNSIYQNQRNFQQNYVPLNQNQQVNYVPLTQLVPLGTSQYYQQNIQAQPQQTQYLYQQFSQPSVAQQRIDSQSFRQPVPYTPLNLNQGQYNEQTSLSQARNLQEQQFIQNQLNRQHNRFDLNNQHAYSKLNCEVLHDSSAFELRWALAGDSIVMQLVAKIDDRDYMAFGVSGDDSGSVMINGDVAVAYIDRDTMKGYAEDYFLRDKSQCSGKTGSCPDNRFRDNTNNVRMLNAATVNGYSIVTYQRPLQAQDEFDKTIHTNQTTPIIWAIGPLNQRNEVSFHSKYLRKDRFIQFGRTPQWNCPPPEVEQPSMKPIPGAQEVETTTIPSRSRNSERRRGQGQNRGNSEATASESERISSRTKQQTGRRGSTKIPVEEEAPKEPLRAVPTPAPVSKRNAWTIPPIQCYEPEDGVFYAQMGPTGGKRGYPAITGHVGWGISWYINGLLIPEINVVRGRTYTFVIEGGSDPNIPAKYHPFYITDDPVGGYEHQSPEERKNVRIFAGVRQAKDGSVQPTGTGRLCHWTQKGDVESDEFASFGAYQRTLELKCDQGEPGVIQWTPDENTPDEVYYQCFTHRHLGWKINVLDVCEEETAASETKIISVPFRTVEEEKGFDKSPSQRVESMPLRMQ
ncbi:hypothetical protein HHI36_007055 [Cryptolaemus montrouzieri]|uniref:Protein Skeletor n=1 Tax=Cryptolaemus montrouzieri TaxID=559131 RepID=A0ABD2MNJ6_9CUCU